MKYPIAFLCMVFIAGIALAQELARDSTETSPPALTPAPSGEEILLSTTKIPFNDRAGKSLGIVGIGRNITRHIDQAHTIFATDGRKPRLCLDRNDVRKADIISDRRAHLCPIQKISRQFTFRQLNPYRR